ncbi:MAG TPA: hypothetical protein ACQGQH_08220 [Xylella sp.]
MIQPHQAARAASGAALPDTEQSEPRRAARAHQEPGQSVGVGARVGPVLCELIGLATRPARGSPAMAMAIRSAFGGKNSRGPPRRRLTGNTGPSLRRTAGPVPRRHSAVAGALGDGASCDYPRTQEALPRGAGRAALASRRGDGQARGGRSVAAAQTRHLVVVPMPRWRPEVLPRRTEPDPLPHGRPARVRQGPADERGRPQGRRRRATPSPSACAGGRDRHGCTPSSRCLPRG